MVAFQLKNNLFEKEKSRIWINGSVFRFVYGNRWVAEQAQIPVSIRKLNHEQIVIEVSLSPTSLL